MTPSPSSLRMTLALGTAVLAISSAATLVLLADALHPVVIAGLRVSVTAVGWVLLAPLAVVPTVTVALASPRLAGGMALSGVLLAIHFGAWIASLGMTSVVQSVALVSTQPLFAGLFGRFLGDRAPWSLFVGAILAALGAAVMVEPGPNAPADAALGNGLALLAAAAAAAYLVMGRGMKAAVSLPGYLAVVNLLAGCVLGSVILATPSMELFPSDAAALDYLAVVAMGIVPGLVGHGLLNWAVRHVAVHIVSVAVLLEPVGAALLAWIVLGRAVGVREAWGAGIVLLGVAFALRVRSSIGTGRNDNGPRIPTS